MLLTAVGLLNLVCYAFSSSKLRNYKYPAYYLNVIFKISQLKLKKTLRKKPFLLSKGLGNGCTIKPVNNEIFERS